MASVTEVKTRGVGALVGTVLQVDYTLTTTELLLREVALVLLSWLWSQERTGPFWVHVASAAESHDALGDLWDVATFIEIDSLEAINIWDTVVLDGSLELVDVFHHLELSTGGVDLGNGAWLEFVHQSAENRAVAENLLEGALGEALAEDGFDPAENLSLELLITLTGNFVGDLGREAI